jgi:hypothetical protein
MIDFDITMKAAIAIRKGEVPNKGMFISFDMSANGRAQAGKTLKQFTAKASETINGARNSVMKAAEADSTGKIKNQANLRLAKIDPAALSKMVDGASGKIMTSVFMNMFIKDVDNFGYKTGITTCLPNRGGENCESHFFVLKRVHGKMYLCYSEGDGFSGSQKCLGSFLEVLTAPVTALADGAKAIVRIVSEVGGKALAQVGHLAEDFTFIVLDWGENYVKSLGDNLAASGKITTASVGAMGSATAASTKATAEFTSQMALKTAQATKDGDVGGMIVGGLGTVGGGLATGSVALGMGAVTGVTAIGAGARTGVCAVGSFICVFPWC